GAARRVRDGSPAWQAPRAAAAQCARDRARRPRRQDDPRATRQAPDRRHLRVLPRQDRPAWLRSRIVRRDRRFSPPPPLHPDPAPRGSIDPFIGIGFRLGPTVDASGRMPDGRPFAGIAEFQTLLASDEASLSKNLAQQFAVFATGRELSFGDRAAIDEIARTT